MQSIYIYGNDIIFELAVNIIIQRPNTLSFACFATSGIPISLSDLSDPCKIINFGGHQSFTVRILGDFPHFLLALPSNNQFIIKLVKMWPGGTPHVVVGTLKISLDQL